MLHTYHIHINGIVQGVGFRPAVYRLAKAMQLEGYVKNGSDGVHILFNASEHVAGLFYTAINRQAPAQAKIVSSCMNKTDKAVFEGFSVITDDNNDSVKQVLIPPDTAVCGKCRHELHDIHNSRYRYPFITCTQCGPRYSIINELPFERHGTAMHTFSMCERCNNEYNNAEDRRFFSQTNSCADCGIKLSIWCDASNCLSSSTDDVLNYIKRFIGEGQVIAVKGIGGYLLLCDAKNEATVQLLRMRKHRKHKPFALLYPSAETVLHDFILNKEEKELLESNDAPIVLLRPKQEAFKNLAVRHIAPRLNRLGIMLPCTPLLDLIANDCSRPLVATSANIAGSPIIYKDEDAFAYLFEMADYITSYNREIVIPQDDSVVQVTPHSKQQIILRRSRGYAPSFLHYTPQAKVCVLSTGAHLKSSFILAVHGNTFVSQFLGSGESYEAQQMYKDTLEHWLNLYAVTPGIIITDKHPGYFSHQYALELAENSGAEIKFVQHHEAHFAAVLAENNLLGSAGPVLGIIWDGTGLGDDGKIWGGEFFKYENNSMLRCCHFNYFPVVAGDKMGLEPRIAALCTGPFAWPQHCKLKEKFTEAEWDNYHALISSTTLFSSSAGRVFDAAASLLGLCDKQTYEGEAAMYLEALADDYVMKAGLDIDASYFDEGVYYYTVPTASLMQGILQDIDKGKAKNYIAAKFHYSLVRLVGVVARQTGIDKICFSGGVFQNALLVDWIKKEYCNRYRLYFHRSLSPNDENISFGQLVYYDNGIVSTDKSAEGHGRVQKAVHPSAYLQA